MGIYCKALLVIVVNGYLSILIGCSRS